MRSTGLYQLLDVARLGSPGQEFECGRFPGGAIEPVGISAPVRLHRLPGCGGNKPHANGIG